MNGEIELLDDEIREKLGTENLDVTPVSACSCGDSVIVGYAQNVLIKYPLQQGGIPKEVLLAGP